MRAMARAGGGTVSAATASKYAQKGPSKAAGSPTGKPGGSSGDFAGGGLVVSSDAMEARLAKIEEELKEV